MVLLSNNVSTVEANVFGSKSVWQQKCLAAKVFGSKSAWQQINGN
jgi:hypothetical protein